MDGSHVASDDVDSLNCTVIHLNGDGELRRSRMGSEVVEEADEEGVHGLLRLPEMTDTSMDSVGQPLREVMDRLNGALDQEDSWKHLEEEKISKGCKQGPDPPEQQPFREDSGGKPPDPAQDGVSRSPLDSGTSFLQASPAPTDLCCFTPNGPDSAATGGGSYDSTGHSQPQTLSGGLEDEGEAEETAGQESEMTMDDVQGDETEEKTLTEEAEDNLSPSESSHPAEFRYELFRV